MNKLQIYIVCHNQKSFDLAPKNDRFIYLIVGRCNFIKSDRDCKIIYCESLRYNIEYHPTLLTFTAWYALVKNNLAGAENIGIFEYDIKFTNCIFQNLKKNVITGFLKRDLPDSMYLDCIPEFKHLLQENEVKKALNQSFWSATSNLIMPTDFLYYFVSWYEKFIPKIIQLPRHSHYHERAINVFAANNNYSINISNNVKHLQLCSHGNKF